MKTPALESDTEKRTHDHGPRCIGSVLAIFRSARARSHWTAVLSGAARAGVSGLAGREAELTAMAETATAAWQADTTTSGAMPWEAFTRTAELDVDKDLYCVATWGILSVLAAPAFMSNSPGKATLQQLPPGQCVGVSMAVRMAWPFSFVAETLTVWHDRKHSTEFFCSDAHRRGMEALRGRVEFRARRVWVRAADLPPPGGCVQRL